MAYARSALAVSMLGLVLSASAEISEMPSGAYTLDKTQGYITFTYDHLGFSNPHVGFRSFDVNLDLDSENLAASTISVTIDANSIDSRVEIFDGHLKGSNFFDTENHPTITFESTAIEVAGENLLTITGDLTIKDITHPVMLETTINKAADHPMRKIPTIGASATARVSRSAWDMGRGVPNVGDEVTIYIEVELPRKTTPPAVNPA